MTHMSNTNNMSNRETINGVIAFLQASNNEDIAVDLANAIVTMDHSQICGSEIYRKFGAAVCKIHAHRRPVARSLCKVADLS